MDNIAQKLLNLSLEGLPLDEPIQAAKKYLEASAAEVKAAFETWIRPGDFAQIVLGPKPE